MRAGCICRSKNVVRCAARARFSLQRPRRGSGCGLQRQPEIGKALRNVHLRARPPVGQSRHAIRRSCAESDNSGRTTDDDSSDDDDCALCRQRNACHMRSREQRPCSRFKCEPLREMKTAEADRPAFSSWGSGVCQQAAPRARAKGEVDTVQCLESGKPAHHSRSDDCRRGAKTSGPSLNNTLCVVVAGLARVVRR